MVSISILETILLQGTTHLIIMGFKSPLNHFFNNSTLIKLPNSFFWNKITTANCDMNYEKTSAIVKFT